jgi:hypothetical protein
MKEDNELWITKMKEALADYSEPAAPEGWGRLEAALRPAAKRRARLGIRWAAAVLILVAAGTALLRIQRPAAGDVCHTAPQTSAIAPVLTPAKAPVPLTALARPAAPVGAPAAPAKEEPPAPPETPEENTDEAPRERRPPDNRNTTRRAGKGKLHLPATPAKKRPAAGRWSIAASFSNAAGMSSGQTQDYMAMADIPSAPANDLPSGMIPIKDDDQLVFSEGIPYLKGTAAVSEIRHRQPVGFGLSVRKYLANGFSVESGVTYTLLSSEGQTMSRPLQKTEQEWHYVGIPLRGNWDFVGSGRFTLYLTAGGTVEKCVYGRAGSVKQTIRPLQFSLTGGIGAQLNIVRRLGIYIEPGISYFFNDGSGVETIRNAAPLNVNLQAGIRVTY